MKFIFISTLTIGLLLSIDPISYAFHRSVFAVCKVFSIGRETNIRGAMRAGKKMRKVHIISTTKGMTGIGRPIHRSGTRELISGKLLGPMQTIRCRSITQFWVLTGSNIFQMLN